ncbi:MAG: hypothetical protein WB586_06845, partial [Chthoniobacterales bacterium]
HRMSTFWCDTSKRMFLAPRIDVGSENDRPLKVVSDCELLAVEVPAGYRLEGRHFAWLKLMPRVSLHLRNWLLAPLAQAVLNLVEEDALRNNTRKARSRCMRSAI